MDFNDEFLKNQEMVIKTFPELEKMINFDQLNKYHKHDLYTHTINVALNVSNDVVLRLSAILHDIGKLTKFQEYYIGNLKQRHYIGHNFESYYRSIDILKRFNLTEKEKNDILFLIKEHDRAISKKEKSIKKFLEILPNKDKELVKKLFELKKADRLDHICDIKQQLKELEEIKKIILERL